MPRRQTLHHFARRPHFFLIFEDRHYAPRQTLHHFVCRPHFVLIFKDRHCAPQPLLPARRFPSFFLLTVTMPSVFLPAPLFCHPERSGGSTIAPAQSIRLFLSFRPRRAESPPSGEILRGAYQKTSAFTPPSASHDGESRRRSRRMRGVHFHVPPPLPSPHTSKRKPKTDDRPRAPHNTAPQFPVHATIISPVFGHFPVRLPAFFSFHKNFFEKLYKTPRKTIEKFFDFHYTIKALNMGM